VTPRGSWRGFRLVDRGAVIAAYVGIGMALTIVVSFTLIIPIEWVIWLLALPAGLIIGYYANQRSNRIAGPWGRILLNGLFAGAVTGLSAAALLLTVKALFFFADNGYRDPGQGGPLVCEIGADCVYERYLDAGRGSELEATGVRDAASFTALYWREQAGSAGTVVFLAGFGGLGGAGLYALFRPRPTPVDRSAATI
jgi:hypothetical protein